MSFSIKVSGAAFTSIVDKAVPYFGLMRGIWLFGDDEAHSKVNLITGALSTKVGSGVISYSAGYAEMPTGSTTGAALDTGILMSASDLASYTFIAVANLYETTPHRLCGTLHSGLNGDAMAQGAVNLTSGSVIPGAAGNTDLYNGTQALSVSPTVAGAFGFGAMTRLGTATALYLGQGSALVSATGTTSSSVGDVNTYRTGPFGSPENPTSNKPQRHAANILCSTALTSAQLLEVYGYLKFKLAKRGVVVV